MAGGWWCAGDAMQRMLSQLLQMMYGMSVQTAAGRETLLTAALQISTVCSDRNLAATSYSHFSSAVVQLANCPASNILCVSVCEIQSNAFCVRCF